MTLRFLAASLLAATMPAAARAPLPARPAAFQAAAPQPSASQTAARVPLVVPRVVARFPHDSAAFTEGLIFHAGNLYESVGLTGRSDVRRVDLATGRVLARTAIPAAQFGEGLAAWKGTLVSLTWHDGVAHRWSAALKPLGTLRYEGEGWGLASDARGFVRSDGSDTLFFHDPRTLAVTRRVRVTLNGRPVTQINELEVVDGAILANVWHTPYILRIDPASGRALAVIDLSALVAGLALADRESVANGIAWDAARRRLFVTGKNWPVLFEIALP